MYPCQKSEKCFYHSIKDGSIILALPERQKWEHLTPFKTFIYLPDLYLLYLN